MNNCACLVHCYDILGVQPTGRPPLAKQSGLVQRILVTLVCIWVTMSEAYHLEALRKQRALDRRRERKNLMEGLHSSHKTSKDAARVGPAIITIAKSHVSACSANVIII